MTEEYNQTIWDELAVRSDELSKGLRVIYDAVCSAEEETDGGPLPAGFVTDMVIGLAHAMALEMTTYILSRMPILGRRAGYTDARTRGMILGTLRAILESCETEIPEEDVLAGREIVERTLQRALAIANGPMN